MRKYKKYRLLFFYNFLTIVSFLITLIYFSNNKYNEFIKINSIYVINDSIKIIVDTNTLKIIEKNKYVYLDSKKYPIEIIYITKNISRNNNKAFHEIVFKINNIKLNNNLNISIVSNKKSYITMFQSCWKEE